MQPDYHRIGALNSSLRGKFTEDASPRAILSPFKQISCVICMLS